MITYTKNITLFLALSTGFVACKSNDDKKAVKQQEELIAVSVETLQRQSLQEPIVASGMLASKNELKLGFKTGGMIKSMLVNEGQTVKAGQLLAELDMSEIDAQVNQAKVGLAKAERDMNRVKKLFADSAATLQTLQDVTSNYEAVSQGIKVAEFNQKLSRIYAPTSGRILRKISEKGELITPFAPALILGTGEAAYYVNVGLSDRDLVKVKLGNRAKISLDAYPNEVFTGEVTQIAQTINPATGTLEVEIKINASGKKLVSGFVAKAEIIPNDKNSFLCVPTEAIIEANGDKAFVFLINQSTQVVSRKEIKIGKIYGDVVAVLAGITESDPIVVKGANFLSDGQKVKIN